ncbi:hypothetical protein KAX97_02785 [candidate division WOR-3 bacterium]|nr:hypothetical protein [candidate division WOR-3 bacterium]
MKNNTPKSITNFFSAENLTKIVSDAQLSSNPTEIEIFDYNILKSKILLASAASISDILDKIDQKLAKQNDTSDVQGDKSAIQSILDTLFKLANTSAASFLAYTEQTIVCAVTAFETYFRDRLATAIATKPEIAKQFADKDIKVKRIIEINFDVRKEIGNLIVEKNMSFQNLDDVQNLYYKIFGKDVFENRELSYLKDIFEIRHLIVHRGSIVDRSFVSKTNKKAKIGTRFMLSRTEVAKMIQTIEKIVQRTEEMVSHKLGC